MSEPAAAILTTRVSVRSNASRFSSRKQMLVVGGAMLGMVTCSNTVLSSTMGIFITSLHTAYGWSRAETSLAWTAFTVVAFLGTALIGRVADHFDPARLGAASMLAFGAGLLMVPYIVHSVTSLWIAYLILAMLGLGTSPVVLLKPVIATFSNRRGFAVGFALLGSGLGAFVLPAFTSDLVERGGWQIAYRGLGACAVVVAPIIWIALKQRGALAGSGGSVKAPAYAGLTFRKAYHSRVFWVLTVVSLFSGLGISGPAAHLIPLLRDHSVGPGRAAALASLLGFAGIVGRIITGLSLDRVKGPLPGVFSFGVGAIGALYLALFGTAPVGVFLIGFVIGAVTDLLAYFTSRYFGLRAQATLFGWNYGMVALGSAIGPVVVGALRDHEGNYVHGLILSSAALAAAGVMCTLLDRYRFDTKNLEQEPVSGDADVGDT